MGRHLALITGGTSGIGFGIAWRLAPQFDLALTYAQDDIKAAAAAEKIKQAFPETRIEIFKRLLSNFDSCRSLYDEVIGSFAKAPLVLVNSAGRLQDELFLTMDFEKVVTVLNEHLVVSMAMAKLCLKNMSKEKWGRIFNLSSISAHYCKRGQSNYAAAKGGVEAFTRTLALEVAHRGITVNAIAPGLIETSMTQDLLKKIEAGEEPLRNRIPAGRIGQPEEVGALVAFLCSQDAAYITGTVIPIDGGRSLGDVRS